MRRRTVSTLPILVILGLPLLLQGAELTGSLLYDGEPLATTFDDIIAVTTAKAIPLDGGLHIDGTVDLGASTYSFGGLTDGRHVIVFEMLRSGPLDFVGDPGNLYANETIVLSDPTGAFQEDLDVRYRYRVLSPVDSYDELDGLALDCTAHPGVHYPITFSIEPPPGATDFTFFIQKNNCPDGSIDWVEIDSDKPSIEVEWGMSGEDYQELSVRCFGASGTPLCTPAYPRYRDIRYQSLFLRNQESESRGRHHANAVVIPAVASTPGAHGTYWSSSVSMTNLSITNRNIVVTYTPRETDGMVSYYTALISLPGSSQISWSDIMADVFSTTGAGAVEILGNDLVVTSRTSTPGTDEGSFGQGIPPLQPTQILSAAGTASATMGGVEEGATFRTNLGLCEVWGESATVKITLLDSSMTELGNQTYELRPYENFQINRVVDAIVGVNTLANGSTTVTVTSGEGRIGAYLSVVDNATGDPTFINIAPQSTMGG